MRMRWARRTARMKIVEISRTFFVENRKEETNSEAILYVRSQKYSYVVKV